MESGGISEKTLPRGMGYKSCWMVVEGASQKAVMDAFLQGRKMKYTYEKGLEKIAKAPAKENRLMVTGTHKKQNYVLGNAVSQFFYETEEFLARCRPFPRVYVYMTHRVSETHGFALVEHGELVRFFKYDENGIESIGQPLPEEAALGYHLPETLEGVRGEEGNFTEVNEEVVMELALRQVGMDEKTYPYKDVRVGKRFEYTAEQAKDPYPRDEDEVSEETRQLPVVQRFSAAKTYREKLNILNEETDGLTHAILDAFGEIIDMYASYGRLSDRTGEMRCMLQSFVKAEEKTLRQEEVLAELSRGNFIFEDKIFRDVVFENIACEKLTFYKCGFHNVQFRNNQIEWLEIDDGYFYDSLFTGKQQGTRLTLYKNYFQRCRAENFEISENPGQVEIDDCDFMDLTVSGELKRTCLKLHKTEFRKCRIYHVTMSEDAGLNEMTDCELNNCELTDIDIRAKSTVSGGWIVNSTGDRIEIADVEVRETPNHRRNTFQNYHIHSIMQKD